MKNSTHIQRHRRNHENKKLKECSWVWEVGWEWRGYKIFVTILVLFYIALVLFYF